jgi:hypothetical protein
MEHMAGVNDGERDKRTKFMLSADTAKEKEFWTLLFEHVDRRSYVRAAFQKGEFGVHIRNAQHFKSSGGKYSLMYTRDGAFKMNDMTYEGQSWNGLDRLKHWCVTPCLPEKFYSELKARNLLEDMEYIPIPG